MQNNNQNQNVNSQATVQPPQGVFVSMYRDDWVETDGDDTSGATGTNIYTINWQDGQGGNGSQVGWDGWIDDDYNWLATSWPQPLPQGTITYPGYNGTNACSPPPLGMEHCITRQHSDYGTQGYWQDVSETADTEMKLATGGPPGSTQKHLWIISATATDDDTGQPIPPDQIHIGAFGNLDTNGNLYLMLTDNDPPNVTPKVIWKKHYHFTVSGTEHPLSIMANDVQLVPQVARSEVNYCVGEGIYFNIANLSAGPYGVTEAVAEWTLPGNFVNRQPDPNCLAYFDVDTNLLTRSFRTNGALTSPCWFVDGLTNGTVSVTVRYRYDKEWFTETNTGMFNVHRPSTQFSYPNQDGTPTVMVVGGILALGNGRDRDMSFTHQINPDNFSDQAGYTQLISGYYTDPLTGVQVPIAPIGGLGTPNTELDQQEFPRGLNAIAGNTNSIVGFYDGPYNVMYAGYAKQDLDISTYLLFKPDVGPGPNIYVPLRLVSWKVNDDAQNGAYSSGNPVATPQDNDCTAFPWWANTFSRTLFNRHN
jgi:hypothetical protein